MEETKLLPILLKAVKKKGKVRFDIGSFHIVKRKKSVFKSLYTGETKKAPAYKAVFFRASDTLKRELNK